MSVNVRHVQLRSYAADLGPSDKMPDSTYTFNSIDSSRWAE